MGTPGEVRLPEEHTARSERRDSTPAPLAEDLGAPPDAPAWLSARFRRRALSIAAIYAAVALLWIYYSDLALIALAPDADTFGQWSVYKGFGFVTVTAILLLWLMWRAFASTERAYEALRISERRLAANRNQLSAVIGSAMDAIVTVDERGRLVLFNQSAEAMFDCPADAALGQPLARFLETDIGSDEGAYRLTTGIRTDGARIPIEAAVSAVPGRHGVRFTAILRDVSRQRAHEAEIERLNRLYAALTDINQAIATERDRDRLFRRVCDGLVEHGGLSLAWIGWREIDGDRLRPLVASGRRPPLADSIELRCDDQGRVLAGDTLVLGGRAPHISNDMAATPNAYPWRRSALEAGFRASALFPIYRNDTLSGVLHVYADSEGFFQQQELELLKRAVADLRFAIDALEHHQERELAEARAAAERRFSDAVIEQLPGIVCVVDLRGRMLRWNRNFEDVTGYGAREIAQMTPERFFVPDGREAVAQRVQDVFRGASTQDDGVLLARDGRTTPFYITARTVMLNEQPCLIAIGIDTTERRKAESALRELNETLEQKVDQRTAELAAAKHDAESADRLKSAFLATMSHELRTPLNSIIGFTGILLQQLAGPLNEEQQKQLTMVRGSARHLLALINDVLDLSKIEAGQLPIKIEAFDLQEVIDQALGTVRPMAEKKGIDLSIELGGTLPVMHSDRRRVAQIILNLLNNALKFTDQGSVTLCVDPDHEPMSAPDDRTIVLAVRDTGIGIRPADLNGLFQPFRQVDTGLAREHEGTGLGLAICRRLCQLLGGRIAAQSEWGVGSTFTVHLPLQCPPTASQARSPSLESVS
ncbi:MAG: PAS domain S-box protein [Pseudomonadales bacterium]|nr:PAS domain S-box protein [Pseudomonadales bacterium]